MERENLIVQLKKCGLKITTQRLAILEVLLEHRLEHPGSTLIFNEARKKAKHVSLSTVYATLKEFVQNGLIRQMEFDRMENRYDVDLSDHVNLICKRCGKIVDYPVPASIEPKEVTRKAGFLITGTRIEFHGYCRDCCNQSD